VGTAHSPQFSKGGSCCLHMPHAGNEGRSEEGREVGGGGVRKGRSEARSEREGEGGRSGRNYSL